MGTGVVSNVGTSPVLIGAAPSVQARSQAPLEPPCTSEPRNHHWPVCQQHYSQKTALVQTRGFSSARGTYGFQNGHGRSLDIMSG